MLHLGRSESEHGRGRRTSNPGAARVDAVVPTFRAPLHRQPASVDDVSSPSSQPVTQRAEGLIEIITPAGSCRNCRMFEPTSDGRVTTWEAARADDHAYGDLLVTCGSRCPSSTPYRC